MMAVIGSALMNKILKLSLKQPTNSMSSGNKPNYLQILQNVVPAFLLLRSKGRWMKQPATISTISAFISTLIKSICGGAPRSKLRGMQGAAARR
jgi:hypothetical protein